MFPALDSRRAPLNHTTLASFNIQLAHNAKGPSSHSCREFHAQEKVSQAMLLVNQASIDWLTICGQESIQVSDYDVLATIEYKKFCVTENILRRFERSFPVARVRSGIVLLCTLARLLWSLCGPSLLVCESCNENVIASVTPW